MVREGVRLLSRKSNLSSLKSSKVKLRILKSMDFVAWSLQLMVHAKLVTLKKIRHTESMSNSTEKAIKFAPRVSMTTANADLSIWLTLIIQLQRRIPMVIEIF